MRSTVRMMLQTANAEQKTTMMAARLKVDGYLVKLDRKKAA
jgi:hypothetical protein